jgi:hypothetical protein
MLQCTLQRAEGSVLSGSFGYHACIEYRLDALYIADSERVIKIDGGGRSLERTALPQIFPANREINREIAEFSADVRSSFRR